MAQPLQCMAYRPVTLPQPSTAERCALLLSQWRGDLRLSDRERSLLEPELRTLDQQLLALKERRLRVAVFGRVGVGKSSLLNALLEKPVFATDVAHGCTRRQQREAWGCRCQSSVRSSWWTPQALMRSPPGPGIAWRLGSLLGRTWSCSYSTAT